MPAPGAHLVNFTRAAYPWQMGFDRTDSATYLASLLAKAFSRALQEKSRKLGFAPGQFPVLLELWREEGLTQRQLIDRLDIEQATLANTLSRMERDGLITRRPHPGDKRARHVFLTPKARDLQDGAIQAAVEADRLLFQGFRQFERELFLEYMRRVLFNSEDGGQPAPTQSREDFA